MSEIVIGAGYELALSPLLDTPYLIADGNAAKRSFLRTLERCASIQAQAERVQERVNQRADALLADFDRTIRSELVAESNQIEGYNWSADAVSEVAQVRQELLSLPLRGFMDAVRQDKRVFEALGLYRAYQMAEEWAEKRIRPNEADIRSLHSLITVGEDFAGMYKTAPNSIEGSALKTANPWDVPRAMSELVSWWSGTSAEPILQAAVIHSWLSQIHPFQDGNGRLARLLANMVLCQHGYPPLMLRASSDRSQYLDALATSDEGDILPLYELFAMVCRRQVRVMGRPDYVNEIIERRLLSDSTHRLDLWKRKASEYARVLVRKLADNDWMYRIDGYPSAEGFELLSNGDADGNCWFLRCGPKNEPLAYLLWFGFSSDELITVSREPRLFPSIFVSRRATDGVHPYRFGPIEPLPAEIVVRPLHDPPVLHLSRDGLDSLDVEAAAEVLVRRLIQSCQRTLSTRVP